MQTPSKANAKDIQPKSGAKESQQAKSGSKPTERQNAETQQKTIMEALQTKQKKQNIDLSHEQELEAEKEFLNKEPKGDHIDQDEEISQQEGGDKQLDGYQKDGFVVKDGEGLSGKGSKPPQTNYNVCKKNKTQAFKHALEKNFKRLYTHIERPANKNQQQKLNYCLAQEWNQIHKVLSKLVGEYVLEEAETVNKALRKNDIIEMSIKALQKILPQVSRQISGMVVWTQIADAEFYKYMKPAMYQNCEDLLKDFEICENPPMQELSSGEKPQPQQKMDEEGESGDEVQLVRLKKNVDGPKRVRDFSPQSDAQSRKKNKVDINIKDCAQYRDLVELQRGDLLDLFEQWKDTSFEELQRKIESDEVKIGQVGIMAKKALSVALWGEERICYLPNKPLPKDKLAFIQKFAANVVEAQQPQKVETQNSRAQKELSQTEFRNFKVCQECANKLNEKIKTRFCTKCLPLIIKYSVNVLSDLKSSATLMEIINKQVKNEKEFVEAYRQFTEAQSKDAVINKYRNYFIKIKKNTKYFKKMVGATSYGFLEFIEAFKMMIDCFKGQYQGDMKYIGFSYIQSSNTGKFFISDAPKNEKQKQKQGKKFNQKSFYVSNFQSCFIEFTASLKQGADIGIDSEVWSFFPNIEGDAWISKNTLDNDETFRKMMVKDAKGDGCEYDRQLYSFFNIHSNSSWGHKKLFIQMMGIAIDWIFGSLERWKFGRTSIGTVQTSITGQPKIGDAFEDF